MNERTNPTTPVGELIEQEWTDEFGSHYRAKIIRSDGRIVSQTVTRDQYAGWPSEREKAATNVWRAALI